MKFNNSYNCACAFRDGFLLAGDRGRLDFVSIGGEMTELNSGTDRPLYSVCKFSVMAVAAGSGGSLIFIDDNGAKPLVTDICDDFTCACEFCENLILGTSHGRIFSLSQDGTAKEIYSGSARITGIASNSERCICVTAGGMALISENGEEFTEISYSDCYGGSIEFDGIIAVKSGFFAYGTDCGNTFALTTQLGGVWAKRDLNVYSLGAMFDIGRLKVTDAVSFGNQGVLSLENGGALVMPECPKCNILRKISEQNIYAAAENQGGIIFAGEGYFYKILDFDTLRQHKIKLPAALEMLSRGAELIDVRDRSEYAVYRIEKSINIPLSELEKRLAERCSDKNQPVIFCCKTGAKSALACNISKSLGYTEIYDLGGIAEIFENKVTSDERI